MSYTQRITKTIAVHYSGRVSYPASQQPGSVAYSGTAYEDVVVQVEVDTTPFDLASAGCRDTVDGLTTSVAATEAAQVASIRENSRNVGQTLINGFFKTVRSEISQQINEFKNIVEATLLKLQSDARRCDEMRHRMEVDYNRKCEQYYRIFNELDSELENRIITLDQPSFLFRKAADSLNSRMLDTDMVSTVSISGGENARLGVQLGAMKGKERAYNAICQASNFLKKHKHTNGTINSSIINSGSYGPIYLPVCYVEMTGDSGVIDRNLYGPSKLDGVKKQLGEDLRNVQWPVLSEGARTAIRRYFNEEVSSAIPSDPHGERVREKTLQLFNI